MITSATQISLERSSTHIDSSPRCGPCADAGEERCEHVAPFDLAITRDGTVLGRRIDPTLPREVLGLFGDYEHAEVVLEDGRKIVAARELGQDEWGYFCEAADWVERSNEIMGEIADENDAIVDEETAAEHIRNALQLLSGAAGYPTCAYLAIADTVGGGPTLAAIERRLRSALKKLAPPAVPRSLELSIALVTTDDSADVAAIVEEIDTKPHLFAAKYLELTRRVERLEQLAEPVR